MSARLASLLRRGEVLAVTAAPGGQRLLHFALVQAVCGTEALGRFANDLSFATMLGLFSAVGWSALVLARVPVAGPGKSAPVMLGLARGALAFTLPACLVLPLLAWGGWVFEPAWTALLLAGWTAYTLARHFGLALAAYRRLLILETVLVVLLAGGLALFGGGPAVDGLCGAGRAHRAAGPRRPVGAGASDPSLWWRCIPAGRQRAHCV
ncbi:MAG: hypothetical protein IPQ01_07245 [Zoogloea sp.]|nr:hypothetical protein [Zoogloea sp.]